MQSRYRVWAGELTDDFVQALKVAYKHREIEIVVSDVLDETDCLMGTAANREHLHASIKDIESGENLVSFSLGVLGRCWQNITGSPISMDALSIFTFPSRNPPAFSDEPPSFPRT